MHTHFVLSSKDDGSSFNLPYKPQTPKPFLERPRNLQVTNLHIPSGTLVEAHRSLHGGAVQLHGRLRQCRLLYSIHGMDPRLNPPCACGTVSMEADGAVPGHGGVDDAKVAGGFDMGIQSRVQDVQAACSFHTSMLQRRVFNDAKTSDIEVDVTVERANVRPLYEDFLQGENLPRRFRLPAPMAMTVESMRVAFRKHPWTSVKTELCKLSFGRKQSCSTAKCSWQKLVFQTQGRCKSPTSTSTRAREDNGPPKHCFCQLKASDRQVSGDLPEKVSSYL